MPLTLIVTGPLATARPALAVAAVEERSRLIGGREVVVFSGDTDCAQHGVICDHIRKDIKLNEISRMFMLYPPQFWLSGRCFQCFFRLHDLLAQSIHSSIVRRLVHREAESTIKTKVKTAQAWRFV